MPTGGTAYFILIFIALLVVVGGAFFLVRRFGTRGLGATTNRGRMPRLAVIDAAAVDNRRRLVLVRRDNVEHLLMIGGPTDIVVEPNIVRAIPGREPMQQRPAVAGAEPPPRIAPLPDAGWAEESPRTDMFDHPEPQMPEPPPRPARPSFADEVRRPVPPAIPMPERRPERAERPIERAERIDPLAGFAPEPLGGRPEPRPELRPEPMPSRVTSRSEPVIPRPPRPEPPKAPPMRAPERAAAPPPPPPPPAPPPAQSADQNLAEMAQRLEAALRRPTVDTVAPPVAPDPPQARPPRTEPPPPPPPQKTGFENLEDEMASLLGRPKNSS
jgi:flagellar protein FliO/FliZ